MTTLIYHPQFSKSESVSSWVQERIAARIEKFKRFKVSKLKVHLSIVNSPQQPGPDRYLCSMVCFERTLKEVHIKAEADDLYVAIDEVGKKLMRILRHAKP